MQKRARIITSELIAKLRRQGWDIRPLGQARLMLAGTRDPYEDYDPDEW